MSEENKNTAVSRGRAWIRSVVLPSSIAARRNLQLNDGAQELSPPKDSFISRKRGSIPVSEFNPGSFLVSYHHLPKTPSPKEETHLTSLEDFSQEITKKSVEELNTLIDHDDLRRTLNSMRQDGVESNSDSRGSDQDIFSLDIDIISSPETPTSKTTLADKYIPKNWFFQKPDEDDEVEETPSRKTSDTQNQTGPLVNHAKKMLQDRECNFFTPQNL